MCIFYFFNSFFCFICPLLVTSTTACSMTRFILTAKLLACTRFYVNFTPTDLRDPPHQWVLRKAYIKNVLRFDLTCHVSQPDSQREVISFSLPRRLLVKTPGEDIFIYVSEWELSGRNGKAGKPLRKCLFLIIIDFCVC